MGHVCAPRSDAPDSLSRSDAAPRWLAALWLLVVGAIGWHQWQFWQAPALVADVFALLPQPAGDPWQQRALRQLGAQGERRVLVLLGAPDWRSAQAAAQAFDAALAAAGAGLRRAPDAGAAPAQLLAFYRPWRDALLTDAQRSALQAGLRAGDAAGAALAADALARLHGLGSGAPTPWLADPLGLWPDWWAQRADPSGARARDGLLWLPGAGRADQPELAAVRDWVLLPYQTEGPALRLDGQRRLADALAAAGRAAQAGADARARANGAEPGAITMLQAGVALHAEAAAAQGQREMNTIGWGSLAAVVALVWWAFGALRPVLLIALALLVGCAAGLSLTALVFGQVHVLTLVFGACLVGVAEDFGMHYFSARLGADAAARWPLMRRLLPGLLLALATSVLAYLVLALVPLPGLRQMALFSAGGLVAAFCTTVCWYPLLDRARLPGSRMAQALAASLERWPVLRGKRLALSLGLFCAACALGLGQLRASDDLRQFQSTPPALMRAQIAIERLLKPPSPAQFFLVQGATPEVVLQREEALKARLQAAYALTPASAPQLVALSDWLPSSARQAENRRLTAQAEQQVLARVGSALGERLQRPAFAAQPLELPAWLAGPAAGAARAQWLGRIGDGYASAVLIRGLSGRAQAAALAALAAPEQGLHWVDRAGDISALLARLRVSMAWLLVAGHVLVWGALALRYGRNAWRAWLPTALASVLCLLLLNAFSGQLQLFNLLALMLLLGMGVDYGIFLLEHRGRQAQGQAWLAVLLGAVGTALSFGLLALSATPALRAFGSTLLLGLLLVCLLAPALRLPDPASAAPGRQRRAQRPQTKEATQ